ncbi:MAG: sensor domain-containing diguanylate cyclase [Treponema sp.]|nr:sensor domain-containing diguanylate cyclase [Treponema sp.]
MRRNLLLLVTSFIFIISFGISTTVSLKSINRLIKENNRDNSVIYVNEVASSVVDIFSEAIAVSRSMNNTFTQILLSSKSPFPSEQKDKIITGYLKDIIHKFGYSAAFMIEDKTLAYYTEQKLAKYVDPSNPDDDWYIPFKESGKTYELNVDTDQVNNNMLIVYINTRMRDEQNNFLGVCGIGVPVRQVMQALQEIEISNNITIKLVSKEGNVRVARSGQIVMERTENEIRQALKTYNYSEPYLYNPHEGDAYTIIKYIPECEWFAVIDYDGEKKSSFSTILLRNLLICLTITLIVLISMSLVVGNFTKNTERFVEEALFDQLTGLKNRRSYQAELEKINAKQTFRTVTVATMDINGLKLTNDSFGHTAGDDLLKGAATAMKNYFSASGWKVFRTGGDEFVAITAKYIEDGNKVVEEFKEELTRFKHNQIKELSVSIGIAQGTKSEVNAIEELIKIADKRMYADKELFYSDSTHERRRR